MIKIGLCGAGGTGKGTLAKEIEKIFPEIKMIPSSVQRIGRMLYPNSKSYKDINFNERVVFQNSALIAQAENEKILSENGISYISERSLIDFLPYMYRASMLYGRMPTYFKYVDTIQKYLVSNPYDILFYIPYDDFELSEDNIRNNSWKERNQEDRKKTDTYIREYLDPSSEEYSFIPENIKNIVSISGTLEERTKTATKNIEKFLDERQN